MMIDPKKYHPPVEIVQEKRAEILKAARFAKDNRNKTPNEKALKGYAPYLSPGFPIVLSTQLEPGNPAVR